MRVALTHPYSWPEVRRGAERIIVETARALAGRGHEVTIYTAGSRPGTSHDDGVTTVRFRRHFRHPTLHEWWFGDRVAPHLAAGRHDVVHSFMPRDMVAALRTQRIGGHATLYDEMGVPFQVWHRLRDRRARERIVRDVDVYACMSQYALDALASRGGRQGVRLPGGVRLDEFQPGPPREPTPTLLFSGAFDVPFKGVEDLLLGLAQLAEEQPDVRLWLSGPGDGRQLLAAAPAAARERTTILPLGRPRDQADRYARAWATVLPSRGESFGMVMLESLACGTPIVTTDDGAPQELATPATGAVARAGDTASMAQALDEALALARDPATVAACRDSVAGHDWDTGLAPLLEELYEDAIGRARARGIRPPSRPRPGAYARRVVRDAARRRGYRVERLPAPATVPAPPVPAEMQDRLRGDHPRLQQLRHDYATSGVPAAATSVWRDDRVREDVRLDTFRGDNLYVWQERQFGAEIRLKQYLALADVAARDRLDILGRCREDGAFGALVHTYPGHPPVSRDLVDSANELNFLARALGVDQWPRLRVLDVGAGYGRLAHRAVVGLDNVTRYDCVDGVPTSTYLCELYLDHRGIDHVARAVPLPEVEALDGPYDLAVNVHSFPEMPRRAVRWWLDQVARLEVPWIFVVPNHHERLASSEPDGTSHDLLPEFQARGYDLKVREPVFADPAVAELIGFQHQYLLFASAAADLPTDG